LLHQEPGLADVLAGHLVELTNVLGYKLTKMPKVQVLVDDDLGAGELIVTAIHTATSPDSTVAMSRVDVPVVTDASENELSAQLIIGDGNLLWLQGEIINIGRDRENDIVIDDPYISRHHVQLRLRDGAYLLFDVNSQAGTFVNGVRVREHRLQTGDVIVVGNTRLLYLEDISREDDGGQTQTFDPYE
jgi:pSer/pThr/pTyr-binding forkhead associated (FHA) protein